MTNSNQFPHSVGHMRSVLPSALKTVLVVDDKECIRVAMANLFEEFGYSVREAVDGYSALHQIRKLNPDILLSDLQMPGMSGRELLNNVRRFFPAIKVIATSGSYGGKEIPAGILADAFYPKGSNASALLQILRELPQTTRLGTEPLPAGSHLTKKT